MTENEGSVGGTNVLTVCSLLPLFHTSLAWEQDGEGERQRDYVWLRSASTIEHAHTQRTNEPVYST